MVFGGLGVMFYGGQAPMLSAQSLLHKVDLQSMFFFTIFVIIVLVLAYLTNPSETSFRTYLTEQSFRQHLSRLEDSSSGDHADTKESGVHFDLSHRGGANGTQASPPFHFTNRAAVSLRTPKHVFYSFGIMTIAAVLPSGTSNRPSSKASSMLMHAEGCGFMVSESWFIGAFGKWWRGGPIQSWWVDSVTNSKDAERCNSGVLDMKALDNLECFEGLTPALSTHLLTNRDSPSKSRVTERSLQRNTNNAPRNSSPPPLPKSASLPLHAPRIRSTSNAKNDKSNNTQRQTQPPSHPPSNGHADPPPQLNSSPSAAFDNSPVISDLLRQISTSNTSIYDLRTQLGDFHKQAAESHAAIQGELDAQRERKRTEDTARVELKARTKTLEDSKRSAEARKREAEKRLRVAENARDSASERIERLGKEISALVGHMSEDEKAIVSAAEEADAAEHEIAGELERKRKEIKVAEDVVAALNARARELEGRIGEEEERLRRAKEQAELRKQDRAFYPLHVVHPQEPAEPSVWSPIMAGAQQQHAIDPHAQINMDGSESIEVFPPALQNPQPPTTTTTRDRGSSLSEESRFSISPRPRHLSLDVLSNFHEHTHTGLTDAPAFTGLIPVPVPVFHDELPTRAQTTRFSPFGDTELEIPGFDTGVSPRSSSLIPTSLIKSLEGGGVPVEDLSRSFQSDNDSVLSRDWRSKLLHPFPSPAPAPQSTEGSTPHASANGGGGAYSTSPTSLSRPPSFDAVERDDPFEIRPPPPPIRHRIPSGASSVSVRSSTFLGIGLRANTDPQLQLTRARTHDSVEEKAAATHRRWFSKGTDREREREREKEREKEKERKGLNPEAKVFQFKKPFPTFPSMFGIHKASAPPPPPSSSSTASHSQQAPPSVFDVHHHTAMASSLSMPAMSLAPPPAAPPAAADEDSASVFSALSMRAFAPSPEEREALSRALASSSNTSLERLPTLMGASLPSSPDRVPAQQQHEGEIQIQPGNRTSMSLLSPGFAWLNALPRIQLQMRKPKFSPWEDEQGEGAGAAH